MDRKWVKSVLRNAERKMWNRKIKCGMTLIGRGDKPRDHCHSTVYYTDLSTVNAVKWVRRNTASDASDASTASAIYYIHIHHFLSFSLSFSFSFSLSVSFSSCILLSLTFLAVGEQPIADALNVGFRSNASDAVKTSIMPFISNVTKCPVLNVVIN